MAHFYHSVTDCSNTCELGLYHRTTHVDDTQSSLIMMGAQEMAGLVIIIIIIILTALIQARWKPGKKDSPYRNVSNQASQNTQNIDLSKKGEKLAFDLPQNDKELSTKMLSLNDPSDTLDEVSSVGELFILSLYKKENCNSLDELSYNIYVQTVARQSVTAKLDITVLLPTSAAAHQHSLRMYMQLQQWLDNLLTLTSRGWKLIGKLANALVVFSSTAEDGEIEVRISYRKEDMYPIGTPVYRGNHGHRTAGIAIAHLKEGYAVESTIRDARERKVI
uniref:Uncharacterized protein n=1 Tax=Timema cristinae TaxID=61476 RepID=A0A7R9HAX3_TIMCR|nr:unnamed protein product [Timema cristinae]